MGSAIDYRLLGLAAILLLSVLASKVSDRFGVPALVLFLALGMLAGSEGPGGVYFDDAGLAQFLGAAALALILFAGGLDTDWRQVRPVLKYGLTLATLGVLFTALAFGLFACLFLGLSPLEGLLLGSIVSSTDAAAVFSVLRSKNASLKGQLKPLLELESGSNDPMAALLTVGLVQVITRPDLSPAGLLLLFGLQLPLGAAAGLVMGKVIVFLVNRLKLGYEGLYPALTLSLVLLTFSLTNMLGGNGFLAVYLAGILVGNHDFLHKRSLLRFHDGMAWLMQIAMFLTLGLLVFPSRLVPILGPGLLAAAWLMFVARPLSVFVCLLPTALRLREKVFIAWVGLRGAVPIMLATYPLLAQAPHADFLFNIVFFVVLASVLVQGTSLPVVARWLRLDAPAVPPRVFPLEYSPVSGLKSGLEELSIPAGSPAVGRSLVDLHLPRDFLVVLIARGNEYLVPGGGTTLAAGDTLLALTDEEAFARVRA
ncbi:MAG TPA: potassium/proton antiporter, partial [Gemmataceae bacterium]|nr:potassium/proton antiporter [Gemmataceae bacterium]